MYFSITFFIARLFNEKLEFFNSLVVRGISQLEFKQSGFFIDALLVAERIKGVFSMIGSHSAATNSSKSKSFAG